MMNVSAGLFHHRLGFYFLHYIDVEYSSEWLLTTDCDLLGSDVFDFNGETVPVEELCPMVLHVHGLDKALNRLCGLYGRNHEYAAKMP